MARGWESKSVEQQMDEAREHTAAPAHPLAPEETARKGEADALRMSRARVVQQLEACRNARYETMLRAALADLDARLAALEK
jgi:hypothetical protein